MNPAQAIRTVVDPDGITGLVSIFGPVNGETTPGFDERLAVLQFSSSESVTLDLVGADYVDSDGVRWLQRLHDNLHEQGVQLRLLVKAGSRVERTLSLLKLESTLSVQRCLGEDGERRTSVNR
jgi:anti-anti-sigma regulatory factor